MNTALDVGGALERAALMEFNIVGGEYGILSDSTVDVRTVQRLVYRLPLCKLVLKISREGLLPDLLRVCGAELRELVLDVQEILFMKADILAISTDCTKLSSLKIHGRRIEGALAPIWRSLGSTLTHIYIGDYSSTFDDVISVALLVQHCLNLYRVDVETVNNENIRILIALSSRIRVLGIENHSFTTQWCRMYRACTNLEAVHLASHGSEAIGILDLMRTKVVSLKLTRRMPDVDRFSSILSHCSVLKNVVLVKCTFSLEELRNLFGSLKSVTALTFVECAAYSDNSRDKDIIDVVACKLRNLDSFTISTYEPLKGEAVSALVGLPRLKSVTLGLSYFCKAYPKISEECAVEVVKTLKDCAQLVQLEIEHWSHRTIEFVVVNRGKSFRIAEAAVMYDRKDFDMFIGGVQYRTW